MTFCLPGGDVAFCLAGGDIAFCLAGGDIALCLPTGSVLRLPVGSTLICDAGEPVLLGGIDVHGIGGRIGLLAGTLFCGSRVNVMGTGPIDVDRSYSNRP